MTSLADSPQKRRSFLDLLATELAPSEGRWANVTRIATGCVVTVAIAMVFQIPEPTYMAYIVFVVSKDDKGSTVTSALGGLAAVILAVAVNLALCLVDTAEPALRLPLMALATFVAMFTSRTFALGPISYLAGFVIVLLQSLVDDVRSPEALTRATLWILVVIFEPVAVKIIVNILFGQGAALLTERGVRKTLGQLALSLLRGDYRKRLPEWRAHMVSILATVGSTANEQHAGRITAPTIAAVLDALVILEAFPNDLPRSVRTLLSSRVQRCLRAIERNDSETVMSGDARLDEPSPSVVAFLDALSRLDEAQRHEAGRHAVAPPKSSPTRPPRGPFVMDAFSNPAHWQFALKSTMAVMLSYAIYTLLDWPGLRTAIVTCFFVALSSLGETVHKLVLRLSGALIGGLIAGVCIVFVLPHLTDIGQLCLLIGGVSLAAAWVATSSELLSYAGMQIAFAFFLGVLQGYAPATDLTVLRDRIVGILLGNIVITIIFSSFWPESAKAGARAAIAEALRAIAALIGRQASAPEARARVVQSLGRADHFHTLSLFELQMLRSEAAGVRYTPDVPAIERLAGAAFVVTSESIAPYVGSDSTIPIAQWTTSLADSVSHGNFRRLPPPSPAAVTNSTHEPHRRLANHAIQQLESEVQRVASTIL